MRLTFARSRYLDTDFTLAAGGLTVSGKHLSIDVMYHVDHLPARVDSETKKVRTLEIPCLRQQHNTRACT